MIQWIRRGISRFIWRRLLRGPDGPRMDFGSTRIYFYSANRDKEWIETQMDAMKNAGALLMGERADNYRRLLLEQVHEIIVADAGRDKFDAREHHVFLRYVPNYTDNYVYLASRLVEIASLMSSQHTSIPRKERHRNARAMQADFLALFAGASEIREWLLRSQDDSRE